MDSDRPDFDKSLPGMGIPKWMKKPEKYDYGDFCKSPPSHDDGFFHFGGQPKTAQTKVTISGQGDQLDCVFRKADKESEPQKGPIGLSSGLSGMEFNKTKDCKAPETTSFFKTVSSSSLVNMASSQATQMVLPIKTSQKDTAAQIGSAGNLRDSAFKSTSMDSQLNMYKGDSGISAPTALESAFPNKLSRRNENPFFTGSTQPQDAAGKSSGSWLFRSSNSAESEQSRGFGNILCEVPTDNKAKTRYIPKPSQLRELNFWSPTSM